MNRKPHNEIISEALIGKGNGLAAMMTAAEQYMRKKKGEKDTEFVKRIALTYNQYVFRLHPDNNINHK